MYIVILLLILGYSNVIKATTLGDALNLAMKNNNMQIEIFNKNIGDLYKKKGATLIFPKVYASASQTDGKSITDVLTVKGEYNFSIGGRAFHEYEKAKILTKIKKLEFTKAKQQILLNAIDSYLELLCVEKFLELNQKKIELLKKHLDSAETQLKLGTIKKTDVNKIKIKFDQEDVQYFKLIRDLTIAKNRYVRTFGAEPVDLSLPEEIPFVDFGLAKARELAQKNNPDLLMSILNFKLNSKNYIASVSSLWPNIQIGIEQRTKASAIKFDKNFYATISLPIFNDGGLNLIKIKEDKIAKNKSMYQYKESLLLVYETIEYFLNNIKYSNEDVVAKEKNIKVLKDIINEVKLEYQEGTKTILDLTSAEVDLLAMEVGLIESKKLRIKNAYDILNMLGLLNLHYLNNAK